MKKCSIIVVLFSVSCCFGLRAAQTSSSENSGAYVTYASYHYGESYEGIGKDWAKQLKHGRATMDQLVTFMRTDLLKASDEARGRFQKGFIKAYGKHGVSVFASALTLARQAPPPPTVIIQPPPKETPPPPPAVIIQPPATVIPPPARTPTEPPPTEPPTTP